MAVGWIIVATDYENRVFDLATRANAVVYLPLSMSSYRTVSTDVQHTEEYLVTLIDIGVEA